MTSFEISLEQKLTYCRVTDPLNMMSRFSFETAALLPPEVFCLKWLKNLQNFYLSSAIPCPFFHSPTQTAASNQFANYILKTCGFNCQHQSSVQVCITA